MIANTKAWILRHRVPILVFVLALCVRTFFIVSAPDDKIATYALGADGSDYVNEALNIVDGHGFSRNTNAPFLPDMIRTPIYPLFLALIYSIFNSFYAALFVKALISATIPLIAMACVRFFSTNKILSLIVGLVFVCEPHMVFYTIFFTSETLFVPFFYLFIYTFMRWIQRGDTSDIVYAGITLGIATLTRPISILIPVLCVGIMLLVYNTRRNKKILLHGVLLVCIFFATLSPWMIRNYIHFNTLSLSTVGWFNVYTRFATDITAAYDKTDFYTAYQKNLDALSTKGFINHPPPVSEREIQRGDFMPILKKESFEIIRNHPKEFMQVSTLATIAVLTHDNTLNILETAWNLETTRPPFSPTLHVAQYGVIPTIKALTPYIHGPYIIPYIGRALWLIVTLLALYGTWVGIRNPNHRFLTAFLSSVVIYFIIFTINASPQIDGRYRTQFFICLILLCVMAYEHIATYIYKRHTHV